jgi:hypothetical protein
LEAIAAFKANVFQMSGQRLWYLSLTILTYFVFNSSSFLEGRTSLMMHIINDNEAFDYRSAGLNLTGNQFQRDNS